MDFEHATYHSRDRDKAEQGEEELAAHGWAILLNDRLYLLLPTFLVRCFA